MNRTRDLEGVHCFTKALDLECEPGGQIAEVSAGRWGAATQYEAAARVHVVFPLPMGMERYGKGGHM